MLSEVDFGLMKLCLISAEYPPETNCGGIGTYTYNLAHALASYGNEVHVIALAIDSERDYDYFEGNVHIHRTKTKGPFLLGNCLIHSYKVFRKLNKLGLKFDAIEVPEWRAEGFVSVFLCKTPLITRLHTPHYLINKLSGWQTTYNTELVNFLERMQTVHSMGITSPTKALQKEIALSWNIDVSRITVIPYGINVERIRSKGNGPNSIASDYIVYVGRLERRKGVHVLARALPSIFEKFPHLKMVFIGTDMPYGKGTMKEMILNINSKYRNNIVFTGYVAEEEMKFSLIKNSKFVVLPSLWENLANTCLESMALGKAVIATKNCGFEEIIEDNWSGFLVAPGDYEALQNRIIECLEADDLVSYTGKNAKRKVEDLDVTKVTPKYLRYYEKVVEISDNAHV